MTRTISRREILAKFALAAASACVGARSAVAATWPNDNSSSLFFRRYRGEDEVGDDGRGERERGHGGSSSGSGSGSGSSGSERGRESSSGSGSGNKGGGEGKNSTGGSKPSSGGSSDDDRFAPR